MAYWSNTPSTTSPINATNLNNLSGGWTPITETLTYSSADSPTFVISTSANTTSYLSVGMKIKLTQTTVKYFIITAISATTITVYGGTDYTLTNAAISEMYFSVHKAPFGFPMNPDKWTVKVSDTTNRFQASPVQNTWYNLNANKITLPIGVWEVRYEITGYADRGTSGTCNVEVTLSTANNTSSDIELERTIQSVTTYTASVTGTGVVLPASAGKVIIATAKTNYFMNARTTATTLANIGLIAPTIIKAVCAYL